jgi:Cytochrome C biogenesis protein transmembrane region
VYETVTELVRTENVGSSQRGGAAAAEIQDCQHFPTKVSRGTRLFLAMLGLAAGAYAADRLLATGGHALSIATLLAFCGGLLSTWSPCGYSSLSLLRPHGHYSVRSVAYWIPTLVTHALGYALGALVLGGGLGLFAWLLPLDGLGGWPLAFVGLLAVGYGLHCLELLRMPYPQRPAQVSHRARNRYAMWKIGLIYGLQLGLNFVTYVRTPILYVVVALALLSGSPSQALWLIAALNVGRWAPLLINALPIQDHKVQQWLASNEQTAVTADGLLLAGVGAAFVLLGLA